MTIAQVLQLNVRKANHGCPGCECV